MLWVQQIMLGISIHSLHAEGDIIFCLNQFCATVFQSTPSMRKETVQKLSLMRP